MDINDKAKGHDRKTPITMAAFGVILLCIVTLVDVDGWSDKSFSTS